MALVIVDVFLVQRPTDALHRPALHLSLDIAGVNGLAGILDRGVAQDGDFAGFAVNFDIDHVRRQARPGASCIDGGFADDRATGFAGTK